MAEPIQCRLLDGPPTKPGEAQPGDMWFADWWTPEMCRTPGSHFSEFYLRDHADKRAPIVVHLPNGVDFMPDLIATNGPGWTVTGEAPNITISPSILVGSWHGWLRNGVLTE